jgi:hypothetical protein
VGFSLFFAFVLGSAFGSAFILGAVFGGPTFVFDFGLRTKS